ncbi:universal stress protein [Phorcysia thermohydrogeniphila]|uniref:Universal stress protein family protein n=1 Tax=Phorcysia thermohydrogeniphila TaxID=936138 RepID=A0A4R1GEH2_9BACT|nr:universal stress protein [Phorcysia thermohydrogeniphila]TCK05191.1 universal stress protein family protein [Phorcysia thermohydrogeniphila]
MLFQKVLYPVDLKPASLNVKPYILKLKEAGCLEVHLLYVLIPSEWGLLKREEYDSEEKISALRGVMNEGYVEGLKKTFRKMQELAEEFEKSGIKTRVLMIPGELDEVIANYAEKNEIKLVALGITSESLSFFRVGKVLDIIKAVDKPILIVKSPEEE